MGSLTKSHLCFLVTFLFAIHVLHYISPLEANNNGGFSARLIRKNLPSRRSIFQPNIYNGGESPVNAYLGQYLMEVSIGTPPVTIQGIADTGSDLVWTQCVPCDNCYKQQKPLFNSQKSSTYSNIACTSQLCHKLDTGVCSPQKQCNYSYGYGDSSLTKGVLAQETLTLEQNRKVSGFIFGCGHNDKGGFNDHEMGIIGLGRGEVSLISQIGFNFGGKLFSMCLVPFGTDPSISSEIRFGSGSEVIGHGVDSTPLVFKEGDKTTYSVTLNGISVGHKFLPFSSSSQTVTKGNMFLDSGTPPTVLPQDLYDRLVAEVRNQVKMEPIKDDPQLGNQLCYKTKTNLRGPILTAHFFGHVNLQLSPIQTFIPPKDGVFCLAFTNTSSAVGIYGNFAQSNFWIGYDLEHQFVSFKATDCTKH
ncbi:hypothetical protein HN51_053047 [Arachis hypogaea]|uniref:aspartic proteinase CDR1-like n=1 Tax=Arachis ipaensis TaxID=130454 RepID=UPI0007AF3E94|nr:aspartic proteinase CDR1-like [Arachis ipaensis]XP_025665322.1 aspartic proteinase CDR1-like [Arachis hypogaea]